MSNATLEGFADHLAFEERLISQFEALNEQLCHAFDDIGLKSLTPAHLGRINETTNALQQGLDEIQQNREVLLTQFNNSTDSTHSDFTELLETSNHSFAVELKQRWAKLLGRAMRARATFESYQMTLLYSVEYSHRLVAGLIDISSPKDRYGRGPDDQSEMSGNLVRKNC